MSSRFCSRRRAASSSSCDRLGVRVRVRVRVGARVKVRVGVRVGVGVGVRVRVRVRVRVSRAPAAGWWRPLAAAARWRLRCSRRPSALGSHS
eukprot:scaffold114851_cov36-Phaeocystis_antarctica.AAC.1